MSVYYRRVFKAKCYNIMLIHLCMTMLLVIERVELSFQFFSGGTFSGIGLVRKQSGYQPHRKCMVYSETECRANAPHGTRRSRKKIFH